MLDALSSLKPALKGNRRACESFIFYMNYRLTFLALLFCCILVSTHQFIVKKINCLSKTHDNNANFMNDYCWSASTYSVQKAYLKEVGVNIPHPGIEGSEKESEYEYRNYYQYVHIVLFIQAVLFYVPHFIWKINEPSFLNGIPVKINAIIGEKKKNDSKGEDKPLKNEDSKEEDKRDSEDEDESLEKRELKEEDKLLQKRNTENEDESSADSEVNNAATYIKNRWGTHKPLAFKYLMCEILATVNVLGQTYLLDVFLYGKFLNLGLLLQVYYNSEILSDPIRLFPLVAVCKFRRYGPTGYIDVISSLCNLPMNALNGKIFICIWIWFTILLFLSLCHVVYLVACMLIPHFRIWPLKVRSLIFKVPVNADSYSELVTKEGDIGDWLVMTSLKRNLEPLNFSRITDIIKSEFHNRGSKAV